MESVAFRLKEAQNGLTASSQKQTLIYLFFNYGYRAVTSKGTSRYVPLKYSTGVKLKPHQWDSKKARAKQIANFDYKSLNRKLGNIETTIKQLFRENPNNTPEQLKKILDLELHPNKIVTKEAVTLNIFIEKFISDIKTGEKKTLKGKNYATGTIETYNSFHNIPLS